MYSGPRVLAGRPCDVQVHEVRPANGSSFVVAVSPAARLLDVSELQRRFRLTCQQAKVTVLLAGRCSDKEIAETLGVALDTAKNHVRAVRMKFHVTSRRDIPGILAASAAHPASGWDQTPGGDGA